MQYTTIIILGKSRVVMVVPMDIRNGTKAEHGTSLIIYLCREEKSLKIEEV